MNELFTDYMKKQDQSKTGCGTCQYIKDCVDCYHYAVFSSELQKAEDLKKAESNLNELNHNGVTFKNDDRIYYGGDMANNSGVGTIVGLNQDKWGKSISILMDDERYFRNVSVVLFSKEYKGHGGTKFVTVKAYNEFRKAEFLRQCPNEYLTIEDVENDNEIEWDK